MKITLAHYSSSQDISGVTTWFENFVLRLKSEGYQPFVQLHHFGLNVEESSLAPGMREAGIHVEVVPRGRNLQADVIQTVDFLNRVEPDIFLPQCLHAHFLAAAIAGDQGLPWALTLHSDDPDYWNIAKVSPPMKHWGKLVCVSEHIGSLAAQCGLDSSPLVIPYGVRVPVGTTAHNKEPFRVVYSGRVIEAQKRLGLVIATLVQACRTDKRITAQIIGNGPAMKSSRHAVKQAGLEHRIFFSGRLTPLEVQIELRQAQAILLMSDFEGLPVSLLEAMSVGVVPVVRSIPSGIPEIVYHEVTGLLVDGQPETAAKELCRLVDDTALWQRCSLAGRKHILENYSDDASYRQWLNVIQDLYSTSSVNYPVRIPPQILRADEMSLLDAAYPSTLLICARRLKCLLRPIINVFR